MSVCFSLGSVCDRLFIFKNLGYKKTNKGRKMKLVVVANVVVVDDAVVVVVVVREKHIFERKYFETWL